MMKTDEFFQFAQVKATLRLLRDDEVIDKELLSYADSAISAQFNKLLKAAVPSPEKPGRNVGEMLPITDDPLLRATTSRRYLVKYNDASMPFEELHYWPLEAGYALSISENRDSTIISKAEDSSYQVKCAKCDVQPVRIINREGELQAIACSRCGARIDRVGTRTPRRKQSGKAKLRRPLTHREEQIHPSQNRGNG